MCLLYCLFACADTSFMYVLAVLIMVKIYQSRHPDVNARAHATFGVLAVLIALGNVFDIVITFLYEKINKIKIFKKCPNMYMYICFAYFSKDCIIKSFDFRIFTHFKYTYFKKRSA